jgi:hypothetical protein
MYRINKRVRKRTRTLRPGNWIVAVGKKSTGDPLKAAKYLSSGPAPMELSIADNGSRQATPVSVSIVGKKEKKRERKVREAKKSPSRGERS